MGLMNDARALANSVLTDLQGFATEVEFTTADGETTVICNALAVRHSTTVNEYGAPVRGNSARVTVSEPALIALDYPTRDINDRVSLLNNKVAWGDAAGDTITYVITEIFPDFTLGIIRCELSLFS